jgi:hypothetical protein
MWPLPLYGSRMRLLLLLLLPPPPPPPLPPRTRSFGEPLLAMCL